MWRGRWLGFSSWLWLRMDFFSQGLISIGNRSARASSSSLSLQPALEKASRLPSEVGGALTALGRKIGSDLPIRRVFIGLSPHRHLTSLRGRDCLSPKCNTKGVALTNSVVMSRVPQSVSRVFACPHYSIVGYACVFARVSHLGCAVFATELNKDQMTV